MLDGSVTLERFAPWFEQRYGGRAYFLHRSHGRVYSSYPLGPPLVVTPLYVPVLLVPGIRDWDARSLILLARVVEKVSASILAAVAVGMFFLLARCYVGQARAAAFALLFAFATSMWSICSQAMWQHTASVLAIVSSLYFLARGSIPGAAIMAALSVAMRPSDFLFVAASMAVLGFRRKGRWRALAWYTGASAVVGGVLAAYNLYVFGSLRGDYTQSFDGAFFEGLAGLLFSPGRGLFVYTPLFLLALWRKPEDRVQWIAVSFAVAHVLLYARWPIWWGGHCFGPRLLAELSPVLVLSLLRVRIRVVFVALAVLSVGIQFVGAFHYPAGRWDSSPAEIDVTPARLWDIRDNPIRRDLEGGINLQGYTRAKELVRAWWERRPPKLDDVPLALAAPRASVPHTPPR